MEGRRRHKEEAARRVREQEAAGMLEPPAEAQTVAQKACCRHGGTPCSINGSAALYN